VLSVRYARQATRIAASKEIAGGSKRKRYGFLADVKVRDPALPGSTIYGRDADTLRGQMVCEVQCDLGGNIHEDDICGGHRYGQTWKFRQTLRERLCIDMIVSEPIDMVFQRIETRRPASCAGALLWRQEPQDQRAPILLARRVLWKGIRTRCRTGAPAC
jgi:hypothetical protein